MRIPKDMDIFGDEVVIREEDGRLVLERPKKRDLKDFVEWLRSRPPLGPNDEFPEFDDPPPEPVDLFDDDE